MKNEFAFTLVAMKSSLRNIFGKDFMPTRVSLKHSGFTLVEIMIVVAVIALLAAIAIPNLQRALREATIARTAQMIKTAFNAVEMYSANMGSYPADTWSGVAPSELNTYLNPAFWSSVPPIGGQWDYDNWGSSIISISILNPTVDVATITDLDAKMDDGNLSTGQMRYFSGRIVYYNVH